jgi:succinate dehydrogenase flavin-adding protein (antitoxin of CptAB toxin-antitoxin module)
MTVMATILDQQDTETTARLELRALERMLGVLCEHIERLTHDARSRGELASREADLQLQAFAERRTQAVQLLHTDASEPQEQRIARLERVVEALDCSLAYFRPGGPDTDDSEDPANWSILLR